MLLQDAKDNKPFNRKNYVVEQKLDGIRCVISNMDELYIYTKQNIRITNKFPELHKCPLPEGTIVDGELMIIDQQGKPDYEAMSTRFLSNKNKTPVTFYAFDILRYKGIDVTGLPLLKRRELLEQALVESEQYKKIQLFEGKAKEYFEQIQKDGLEGIVIKRSDVNSKYTVGKRSNSWQKVINWLHADVYISGYRKSDFGLLASIDAANGSKVSVGVIESGVTPEHKQVIDRIKSRLVYKEDKSFAYMEPLLMAKIKTKNWTRSGKLRSPVFMDFVI
ncbi:DNA ligase [Paenibacillus sp. SYP-B3998]|uniref:DNA ligase n=1 Tax=Paenibacillus sp. SYP-B3998 TaxID=2678564 RepID=A0A6G4A1Y5_9BACL|nr:RNA ligase family protein [Paenibacillus sp. SYP-B3998]NEW07657.1 DNA ligase [Paenibacillus sp. SYP-B3998]